MRRRLSAGLPLAQAQEYWAVTLEDTKRKMMEIDKDDAWDRFSLVSGAVEGAALNMNVLTEPHVSFLDGLDEEQAGHEVGGRYPARRRDRKGARTTGESLGKTNRRGCRLWRCANGA